MCVENGVTVGIVKEAIKIWTILFYNLNFIYLYCNRVQMKRQETILVHPKIQRLQGPLISFVIHALVIFFLLKFVTMKTEESIDELAVYIHHRDRIEIEEISPVEAQDIAEFENEAILSPLEAPVTKDVNLDELDEIDFENVEIDERLEFNFNESFVNEPLSNLYEVSELYKSRTIKHRSNALNKFGGSEAGQDALLNALRWLKDVQSENGSWVNKPAHTALAILSFLAHGDTTLSEEFGSTIQNALHFLVKSMPSDGSVCGKSAYVHGITTYALSEAYGITNIPFLKSAMEYGVLKIVEGQQDDGGYDYKYKKGKRWGLSIAGWQIQAMKAAYAAGSECPGLLDALEKSTRFVKSTYKNGKFGYSSSGSGGNMTGVGTLCLQLLGKSKSKEAKGGYDTIISKRIKKLQNIIDESNWSTKAAKYLYGWYYETQAVFHKGGNEWKKWNRLFQNLLLQNQHDDGHWQVNKAAYGFKNSNSR